MGRCKRHVNELPDDDRNGRMRREPPRELPDLIKAKFVDGPLAGQTLEVREQDYITIGGFTYSYAGKEKRVPLYARLPKSRAERRMLMAVIAARGKDPRVTRAKFIEERRTPKRKKADA
jgi:hypothetical protein